jgi:hypothetical protein
MMTGMIVGLIVGLIGALSFTLKTKGAAKKVLSTLDTEGADAARLKLEQVIRPLEKIGANQIVEQRDRMAALGIIGDVASIEREMARHQGPLPTLAQVHSVGLLGIVLRGDDAKRQDAARQLDALATRVETESGRIYGLVKKKTRAMAHLARTLATGEPLRAEHQQDILPLTRDIGIAPILASAALAQACDATGMREQAEQLRQKIRLSTKAFG